VSPRAEEGIYAPAVLIAIGAPLESDGEDAKEFGVDDLAALGGDFERYAQALQDGNATCDELDFPPTPHTSPLADSEAKKLFDGGPVIGRCVVRVLGTGLFSIDERVSPADARRIHECSAEIRRELRREHAQLRAERAGQIERIHGEAELPASLRAALAQGSASSPGVKANRCRRRSGRPPSSDRPQASRGIHQRALRRARGSRSRVLGDHLLLR
jgi:hypothetical protein